MGWKVGSRGRGHIYIPTADSCWCMAEATQYYKAILLQLNINKIFKKQVLFLLQFREVRETSNLCAKTVGTDASLTYFQQCSLIFHSTLLKFWLYPYIGICRCFESGGSVSAVGCMCSRAAAMVNLLLPLEFKRGRCF